MKKFIIEISEEGMKKTFIDGDKQYEEEWVQDFETEYRTIGTEITEQLEEQEKHVDPYLLELLAQEELDLFELWEYFKERSRCLAECTQS